MPFANKSWVKGLKLEAMNSKLEYTGVEWCWALANDEYDGTDSTKLLQFTQAVFRDKATACQGVNNSDTNPGITAALEPLFIDILAVLFKQVEPGLTLDSWPKPNKAIALASSGVFGMA